jgi:hypothetical protein
MKPPAPIEPKKGKKKLQNSLSIKIMCKFAAAM